MKNEETTEKSFLQSDLEKSGLDEKTIKEGVKNGDFEETEDGYKINYLNLYNDEKTGYYNKKKKNVKDGHKYSKKKGVPPQLYRPRKLNLKKALFEDKEIGIVEGEKKAEKAVLEGFNFLSVGGVYGWKQNPENSEDGAEIQDIIPNLISLDLQGVTVNLCYDADMFEKEQVRQALYSFAAYLIGEKQAKVKIVILPKGEEKGLDDFLIAHGKEKFQELLDNAKEITLKEIQEILAGNADKKIQFPMEIFEPKVGDLIVDLAKRMNAPREYIAASFITGASILMDGVYSLNVQSSSNWVEHPILWAAIVGGASQKKTPCLNIIKAIIDKIELQLQEKYEEEEKKYKRELSAYKREKEQNKKNKDKKASINLLEEPEKPYPQVITVQNATTEALSMLLKNNHGRGIGIFVDELASFLKGLGQYKNGNGADEEYLLQAWKKQQGRQARKTDNENFIIIPSHNIIGTIQPHVLELTLLKDGLETTNGMIERWLFVCSEYEEIAEIYDKDEKYDVSIIEKIYSRLYSNQSMITYYFSKNARAEFNKLRQRIVHQKKNGGFTELMKNYLQKQTDYVARFSLILHCIKDDKVLMIDENTIKDAIKLSNYFIECFQKVANISLDAKCNAQAMSALDYMRIKGLKTLSPSKLHRSNTSKYKTKEVAKNALLTLANLGYGRLSKTKNNGMNFIFYS